MLNFSSSSILRNTTQTVREDVISRLRLSSGIQIVQHDWLIFEAWSSQATRRSVWTTREEATLATRPAKNSKDARFQGMIPGHYRSRTKDRPTNHQHRSVQLLHIRRFLKSHVLGPMGS